MKGFKLTSTLLAALMVVAVFAPCALAEGEQGDSITITIDRLVMPQSLLHPGRALTKPEIVMVYDHVIRSYDGKPIDSFTIQTASGRTDIPIENIREITIENDISRRTGDIHRIENVVEADIVLVDGTEKHVVMNADFGTIEGNTDRGEFFLKYPHTVRHIVFNR